MKHTQEEYDALVEIVGESLDHPELGIRDKVNDAYKPFREPKPARIRSHIGNNEVSRSVELTDAVKARLGPTAGVSGSKMEKILTSPTGFTSDITKKINSILKLIAGAAPPIDGEL